MVGSCGWLTGTAKEGRVKGLTCATRPAPHGDRASIRSCTPHLCSLRRSTRWAPNQLVMKCVFTSCSGARDHHHSQIAVSLSTGKPVGSAAGVMTAAAAKVTASASKPGVAKVGSPAKGGAGKGGAAKGGTGKGVKGGQRRGEQKKVIVCCLCRLQLAVTGCKN